MNDLKYGLAGDGYGCVASADGTGDYPTIQDAIDASVSGDTLLLANGEYSGTGNWDIDFGGKDLVMKPYASNMASVIIDCLGGASGAHRAFYFHSGETPAAKIRHITITNGYLLDENGGVATTFGIP